MKRVSIIAAIIVHTCCLSSTALACEGARPLAMGGAFTGLADDANATYWNPAAMGVMEQPEITYTGTVYDRNVVNYDDWASIVVPLRPLRGGEQARNLGSIGLSFMNNVDKSKYTEFYYGMNYTAKAEETDRWYTISYGCELKELVKGLCVGANFRYWTIDGKIEEAWGAWAANSSSSDSAYAVDLAMYYKWQDLSVGFLYQSVNEPEFNLFGSKLKYGANFRPGIAYRCFNDRLIISGEVYDAFDHMHYRNIRIGGEAKVTDNIALRMGGYDITATEKAGRAITGGLGLLSGKIFGKTEVDLSYAALYWYESKADTKDKFTHMLGISAKF